MGSHLDAGPERMPVIVKFAVALALLGIIWALVRVAAVLF